MSIRTRKRNAAVACSVGSNIAGSPGGAAVLESRRYRGYECSEIPIDRMKQNKKLSNIWCPNNLPKR